MKKIKLYENGYEPYIDFLKGYLILAILFCHGTVVWPLLRENILYYLLGGAPTAGFMLVCTMQIYRNGLRGTRFNLAKVCFRVLAPFMVLQLFWVLGHLACKVDYYDSKRIQQVVISGGYGIGSYFPWVFYNITLSLVSTK